MLYLHIYIYTITSYIHHFTDLFFMAQLGCRLMELCCGTVGGPKFEGPGSNANYILGVHQILSNLDFAGASHVIFLDIYIYIYI